MTTDLEQLVKIIIFLILASAFIGIHSNRTLNWARLFFPSWRFFDRLNRAPQILFRQGQDVDKLGSWQLFVTPRRGFKALVFNPKGNVHLAINNLVERLIEDLKFLSNIEESVSYRLVNGWVRWQVLNLSGDTQFYQFKVVIVAEDAVPEEEFFVSPIHSFQEITG